MSSEFGRTRDIKLDRDFRRAGVIPYYYKNNKRFYLLSIYRGKCFDINNFEYSDFGGSVNTLDGENFVQAAARELYEETSGCLDFRHQVDKIYQNTFCSYSSTMILIYLPLSFDNEPKLENQWLTPNPCRIIGCKRNKKIQPFNKIYDFNANETVGIEIFSEKEFLSLIERRNQRIPMYFKTRNHAITAVKLGRVLF